ncbi:MAG: hypothetical protein ACI4EO_07695, partial [Blautia sp.]
MKVIENLDKKMNEVISKCIGKNVILYGYGKSGQFIEWLLDHVYGKQFMCLMDDNMVLPGISIHRKIILDYIDPEDTVILVSFRKERMTEKCVSQMTSYGYEDGKNMFFLKEMIAPTTLSFYSFMEHEYGV